MRTADQIEENKAQKPQKTAKVSGRGNHPNSRAALTIAPFLPGVSGNPGGKPRTDVAAALARAVIEGCEGSAYMGLAKALCKGNAYVFKELAERGYGKLKEIKEVTHRYEDVPDPDLDKRLSELLRDLGLAGQIDEAGAPRIAGGEEKTNGAAKDPVVLS
jgi:hypothetical protein